MTTVDNKAESHTFDIEVHHANNPVACLVLGHGAGAGKPHNARQDVRRASTLHLIQRPPHISRTLTRTSALQKRVVGKYRVNELL